MLLEAVCKTRLTSTPSCRACKVVVLSAFSSGSNVQPSLGCERSDQRVPDASGPLSACRSSRPVRSSMRHSHHGSGVRALRAAGSGPAHEPHRRRPHRTQRCKPRALLRAGHTAKLSKHSTQQTRGEAVVEQLLRHSTLSRTGPTAARFASRAQHESARPRSHRPAAARVCAAQHRLSTSSLYHSVVLVSTCTSDASAAVTLQRLFDSNPQGPRTHALPAATARRSHCLSRHA